MTPEEFAKFALDRRRLAVLGLLAVGPVDTDGLVELGEDVVAVAPGETVGFIPYASLF